MVSVNDERERFIPAEETADGAESCRVHSARVHRLSCALVVSMLLLAIAFSLIHRPSRVASYTSAETVSKSQGSNSTFAHAATDQIVERDRSGDKYQLSLMLLAIPNVDSVHDLHVWSIVPSAEPFCTGHLVVWGREHANDVLEGAVQAARSIGISRSTFQVETCGEFGLASGPRSRDRGGAARSAAACRKPLLSPRAGRAGRLQSHSRQRGHGAGIGVSGSSGESRGHVGEHGHKAGQVSAVHKSLTPTSATGGHAAEQAPSLFCFSVMQPRGMEELLVKAQLRGKLGIFGCDGWAVVSTERRWLGKQGTKDMWSFQIPPAMIDANGAFGESGSEMDGHLSAGLIRDVWEVLMEDGGIWSFDFTVKVDPDTVFLPKRVSKRVGAFVGKPVYFTNCNEPSEGPKLYGSLEVFSKQAIDAYRDGRATCTRGLEWRAWGENRYMQECMDRLRVPAHGDFQLVGDARCRASSCTDGRLVAFHGFKTLGTYLQCVEQAKQAATGLATASSEQLTAGMAEPTSTTTVPPTTTTTTAVPTTTAATTVPRSTPTTTVPTTTATTTVPTTTVLTTSVPALTTATTTTAAPTESATSTPATSSAQVPVVHKSVSAANASGRAAGHTQGPSLFCFSVMMPRSPEEKLLTAQAQRRLSIFDCDAWAVLSSERRWLAKHAGTDFWSSSVPIELTGVKGVYGVNGSKTNGYLNAGVFRDIWEVLLSDGGIWSYDFTVKVDPDAVFFPRRLYEHIGTFVGKPVYFTNCNKWSSGPKLYGSLEIFSKQAVGAYKEGRSKCSHSLAWQGWGEDQYMQECMDLLKVPAYGDFKLVGDAHCMAGSCTDVDRVAFHGFKTVADYLQCVGWAKAAASSAAPTTTPAAPLTTAAPCGLIEPVTNYVVEGGWGLHIDHIASPEACCVACQQHSPCKAWIWVKDAKLPTGNPSQCWMKGNPPTRKEGKRGFVSGIPFMHPLSNTVQLEAHPR